MGQLFRQYLGAGAMLEIKGAVFRAGWQRRGHPQRGLSEEGVQDLRPAINGPGRRWTSPRDLDMEATVNGVGRRAPCSGSGCITGPALADAYLSDWRGVGGMGLPANTRS
jgi:hypothetical protein